MACADSWVAKLQESVVTKYREKKVLRSAGK